METFAKEAWFPVGIAQSIEPAASQVPEGFEAWRLHTTFDSHLLFWPTGDTDSIDWWQRVISQRVGRGGISRKPLVVLRPIRLHRRCQRTMRIDLRIESQ